MELISNVPSSSSSSNTSQFKYDVFISFRGEDTRYNFTSHLYKALRDKQIQTYIDDELDTGDKISQSVFKAIEESKISVIIFSEGYASSGWCLQELVKILECKKSYGQIEIPVFYHVDPSNVRKQTGTFGDAFRKHDQQQSLDQVQRLKDALEEAAGLSGWDSSIIKDESVLIENIVKDILRKLNNMSASDAKGLVGIDTKIEQTVSLLGREDVRSVGIWGIGGIGKTTLAKAVFNKISSQFECSYFIPNIREESEQSGGLNHLRRDLLSAVLDDGNVNVDTASVRHAFTRKRLGYKKLLIVFDDVTDFQQIETLIGGFDCLNSQSRIIITTRDKQVLRNCGVDQVYEGTEMIEAISLDMSSSNARDINLSSWAFAKMENLEFDVTDVWHNRGNKMEYLKPVNFYKKIFKDILKKEDYLKPCRLLGLDVSDKYVSLAVSDWKNLTAVPLRVLDRQEINMSSMADMIQSLIPEYNPVGFVFGAGCITLPIDAQAQKFIDDLCETGKFEGLKYTAWDYGIASQNAEFVFNQHLKFTLDILNQPPYMSETIMEMSFAVFALQGYLDCTNKMLKEDWD